MRLHILRCIFLSGLLLFTGSAGAQYYNLAFRNYSSYSGLSQSEVQCVFEDSEGFLWIGTSYGLTMYDGRDFKTYYNKVNDPTTIGGNVVTDIAEDRRGDLWMTVFNSGVSRLDPLTKKFTNFQPSRSGNSVVSSKTTSLIVDRYDRLWIGTSEGLSVYDVTTGRFSNMVNQPEGGGKFDILALENDRAGRIWIGGKSGIYFSDGGVDKIRKVNTDIPINSVNALQFDKNNNGWIATNDGIYSFELLRNDSIKVSRPKFFPNRVEVEDIEFDSKGNLWVGTRTEGLGIFFPSTGFFDRLREDYSSTRGLLSNRITDLYFDNSGGMWVSGENGLQSFHDGAQRFNIYPGLSNMSDMVRGSTLYGISVEGNLVLVASSGGVIVYNRITGTYLPVEVRHENKNAAIRYRYIEMVGKDTWWVTSDHGLYELVRTGDNFILRRPAKVRDRELLDLSLRNFLKDGNSYWFAVTHSGLIRYDMATGRKQWYRHEEQNTLSLPNEVVNKIKFDKEGNLLVGHEIGLSILYKGAKNFETFTADSTGKGLSNKFVFDMHDDGKRIWIATFGGGLNVLDKKTKKIHYLNSRNGLCDDAIYVMVAESDTVIWLGTNKGLARFSTVTLQFRNFERNDGMPSEEFNMLSGFLDTKGEIYMGTVGGIFSFDPVSLTKNELIPDVHLTRIRKNGISLGDSVAAVINRDRKLESKYGEDLILEFSPMTFYGMPNPVLRYRIREAGGEWVNGEAGGLLPLVKMEPGDYTIDVEMKNHPGSDKVKTWTFSYTVLPPFWRTLWFWITATLFMLLAVYAAVMAYIRRRLERQRAEFLRQQAVEQERSRISAELHDDIGGGLTAIRLLSEMSLEHNASPATSRYLSRISTSSNELIQKMNEIVWALNVNNDSLQSLISYTRQYAMSYLDDLDINCSFETPQDIPDIPVIGKNRRSVFLLVKESLNNVVKHAGASKVRIRIDIDADLRIRVADNGKGIELSSVGRGNGLKNMRKRVESMRGNMQVLNGEGTTMQFDIPLKNLTA